MANKIQFYAVAVDIGNKSDISHRACQVLASADLVICESIRRGQSLLNSLGLDKPTFEYSEHSNRQQIEQLITEIHSRQCASTVIAWISDCGTPNFADPGYDLLRVLYDRNFTISPVPGCSALTAILSICDFDIARFYYAGFLARKKEQRLQQLRQLEKLQVAVVIQDVPYRYAILVNALSQVYKHHRCVLVGANLTQANETIFRGSIGALHKQLQTDSQHREFIIVIDRC